VAKFSGVGCRRPSAGRPTSPRARNARLTLCPEPRSRPTKRPWTRLWTATGLGRVPYALMAPSVIDERVGGIMPFSTSNRGAFFPLRGSRLRTCSGATAMSHYELASKIIALSDSDNWDEAKLEWSLVDVYKEDEPDTCLCGHYPIIENCILRNRVNCNQAVVGNVCVKKFLGLPSDKIFDAINRISQDNERPLNAEAIDHAHRKGWISDWERKFYFDTLRKRNLSAKQLEKRIQINTKVLRQIARNRPGR
jgi:hypothetical protein